MKALRIGLVGADGKMGKEIVKASKKKIAIVSVNRSVGPGNLKKNKATKSKLSATLENLSAKKVNLVIDFSSPEGMSEALDWCVENRTPFLSGTTGVGTKQEAELRRAGKKIPVFWASNFSLGIAMITEMLRVFSKNKNFSFQIEELHHKHKKDRPSGTAKSMLIALEKITKKRAQPTLSIRRGEIFGIHRLWARNSSENILIEHTALNRGVFAEGALKAGAWLVGQKPGNYTMQDFLTQK